jgi:Flp pilus assembly pilin Flp
MNDTAMPRIPRNLSREGTAHVPMGGKSMTQLLVQLVRDESGQDLAEYGIALAVIAAGAALIAVLVAQNVQTLLSNAQTAPSHRSRSGS